MKNIQDTLNGIFKYPRSRSDAYEALDRKYNSIVHQPHTNVRVESAELGFYGIAHHLHEEQKGIVLVEYAVDRKIRRNGPILPEPFEMFQDCEHHYYGLKLNLLAYLAGKRLKEMFIRDCYNNESIPVRQNKLLVEEFLTRVLKRDKIIKMYPTPAESIEPSQHKLFA